MEGGTKESVMAGVGARAGRGSFIAEMLAVEDGPA